MGIRANLWTEAVYEMLAERAMISTEIAEMLKTTARGGRYPPSPRRVTFVLRNDNRFKELGEEIVGTIARNRSHPVKLIGRRDKTYQKTTPYRVIRGMEDDLE